MMVQQILERLVISNPTQIAGYAFEERLTRVRLVRAPWATVIAIISKRSHKSTACE